MGYISSTIECKFLKYIKIESKLIECQQGDFS